MFSYLSSWIVSDKQQIVRFRLLNKIKAMGIDTDELMSLLRQDPQMVLAGNLPLQAYLGENWDDGQILSVFVGPKQSLDVREFFLNQGLIYNKIDDPILLNYAEPDDVFQGKNNTGEVHVYHIKETMSNEMFLRCVLSSFFLDVQRVVHDGCKLVFESKDKIKSRQGHIDFPRNPTAPVWNTLKLFRKYGFTFDNIDELVDKLVEQGEKDEQLIKRLQKAAESLQENWLQLTAIQNNKDQLIREQSLTYTDNLYKMTI